MDRKVSNYNFLSSWADTEPWKAFRAFIPSRNWSNSDWTESFLLATTVSNHGAQVENSQRRSLQRKGSQGQKVFFKASVYYFPHIPTQGCPNLDVVVQSLFLFFLFLLLQKVSRGFPSQLLRVPSPGLTKISLCACRVKFIYPSICSLKAAPNLLQNEEYLDGPDQIIKGVQSELTFFKKKLFCFP